MLKLNTINNIKPIKGVPTARMQGTQRGKLVKVQHCPATVTHFVKSDDPPFMTQSLRGKASWALFGKISPVFSISRPFGRI